MKHGSVARAGQVCQYVASLVGFEIKDCNSTALRNHQACQKSW
jgi:hypothetical protein